MAGVRAARGPGVERLTAARLTHTGSTLTAASQLVTTESCLGQAAKANPNISSVSSGCQRRKQQMNVHIKPCVGLAVLKTPGYRMRALGSKLNVSCAKTNAFLE